MRVAPEFECLSVLLDKAGAPVPLKGVTARGRLEGLVFELSVEQVYRNDSPRNIEAEYTFPVPLKAVLLGLELQIGDRALEAVAVRRHRAREDYERAMDEGDSAALLEQAGEGLWSLSLGNLMPGEEARIRYRYAQVLDRKGDQVRLAIPTVIAPRYGNPADSGLAPHQVPGTDLTVDYPFGLTVEVRGTMAGAVLASPSHRILVRSMAGDREVTLCDGTSLDRDFILTLSGEVTRSAALLAPDVAPAAGAGDGAAEGPGYVALVSVDPGVTESGGGPLALKLVVDCSGSMAGTSIECARRALLAALDRLQPTDRVSLTRFGTTVDPATPGLVAADPDTLASLRRTLRNLQADLGGTNMQAALEAAMAIPTGDAPVKDILLITDGEIWSVPTLLERAARSGHRLFVVAVGASPAEALAESLGERTGGACEFVSPGEEVEGAILRMFCRLREAPKRLTALRWPEPPLWEGPRPAAVFSGDTLHLVAGFARRPVGDVQLTVAGEGAFQRELRIPLGDPMESGGGTLAELLPRLVAARRLLTLEAADATALAERYQLASSYTSFVVVKVRADGEKAVSSPVLAKVPQMMAAGWGGGGVERLYSLATPAAFQDRVGDLDLTYQQYPTVADPALGGPRLPVIKSPAELLAALARRNQPIGRIRKLPATVQRLGLPEAIAALIRQVARATSLPEARVMALFIALLADSPVGASLDEAGRTRLKGTLLADSSLRDARRQLRSLVGRITATNWDLIDFAPSSNPPLVLED